MPRPTNTANGVPLLTWTREPSRPPPPPAPVPAPPSVASPPVRPAVLTPVERASFVEARKRRLPHAEEIARLFSSSARFRVYTKISLDGTGRIGQLAVSCPGAALFAFGLEGDRRGYELIAEEFWEGVLAGTRLDRILKTMLGSWLERCNAYRPEPGEVFDPPFEPFLPGPEWDRLLLDQRWLVRHASARVATSDIVEPPPLAFTREDVPRDPAANAIWFRTMKFHWLNQCRAPHYGEAQTAMSRWASAQTEALGRLFPRPPTRNGALGEFLSNLLDYLQATGRRPPRSLSPERLRDESTRWHTRIELHGWEDQVSRLLGLKKYDDAAPLPAAPFGDLTAKDFRIAPITKVGDLRNEGEAMHNCVAWRMADVVAGGDWIASATVFGDRITMQVHRREDGQLKIYEAKRACNEELTSAQKAKLAKWLHAINTGARLEDLFAIDES